jgi:hypothetical protein
MIHWILLLSTSVFAQFWPTAQTCDFVELSQFNYENIFFQCNASQNLRWIKSNSTQKKIKVAVVDSGVKIKELPELFNLNDPECKAFQEAEACFKANNSNTEACIPLTKVDADGDGLPLRLWRL